MSLKRGETLFRASQRTDKKEEQEQSKRDLAQLANNDGTVATVKARRNEAIGQALGSLRLLTEVLRDELGIWRGYVHQRGVELKIFLRNFFLHEVGIIWQPVLRVFASDHPQRPVFLEGSAALGEDTSKYQEKDADSTIIASYSLAELEKVLLTDVVEDGVTRRFQFWSKPWSSLPVREINADEEGSASEFQLFNRPLSYEDDEALSLPSTHQTTNIELQTLQAQILKLSRQLSAALAAQDQPRSRFSSGNTNQKSPMSNISSDEGVCMQSVSSRMRTESPVPSLPSLAAKDTGLPMIRPPAGLPPPPPPPPPGPLPSARIGVQMVPPRLDLENLPTTPLKTITSVSVESTSSPGIRVQDLMAVRLRKTTVAKSPGGTPLQRDPLRDSNNHLESGEFFAVALKNKFRNVQPLAEDDESNTNTSFNDDEWTDDAGDATSKHTYTSTIDVHEADFQQ